MRLILAATATLSLILGGCAASGTATPILAVVTPSPAASPTAAPTVAATLAPVTTPAPTVGPCDAAKLAARIVSWDAGAGHRTAHVELTNAGTVSCKTHALATPQLVGGNGSVLIDGTTAVASPVLTLAAGAVVKALIQDDNYCGPAPVAPVTVAFIFTGGGRIVAAPVSATDVDGVPPCFGSSGAGVIEMQPWAP